MTAHDAAHPGPRPAAADHAAAGNRTLFVKLGVIVLVMFAFGYALVPFYEKICQVTGMRDVARADEVHNTQVDATRSVRIEFDSNVRKLPWDFRPLETIVGAHPGEVVQVTYEIHNTTGRDMTGQAIPSYAPPEAAQYFKKLECFCFTKQTLKAGETRRMPVVFVVDPALPKDIPAITLSYTFFEVEGNARN
jgi:cytochrome c oxidase assembly protein subunit 11